MEGRCSIPRWSAGTRSKRGKAWIIIGIAAIVIGFAYLEMGDRYYFVQDDGYIGYLPLALHGGKSLFSGVFPEWDPYQGGGEPTTCTGILNFTYPPLYAAYGIAHYVIRNDYAMLEVLGFFHIVFAFLGMYWAGRKWGLSPALATAAGLCFASSGFFLSIGRGWMNYFCQASWLPWLAGVVAPNLMRHPNIKWFLGAGAVIGLSFHAGFIQIWVYGLAFAAIIVFILAATRVVPPRAILRFIIACLLGLAIAAPLLWVEADFSAAVARHFDGHERAISWSALAAMLIPPRFMTMKSPLDWGAAGEGQFYYSGTILVAAWLLLGVAPLAFRWNRRIIAQNVLSLCAVIAFLFCLGDKSPLPIAVWASHLPVFDKFRYVWRCFAFVTIFTSLGGALCLERLCSASRFARYWRWILSGATILLVAYSMNMPRSPLYRWPGKPYPPLNPEFRALLQSDQPHGIQRSMAPLRLNEYANWYKIYDYPATLLANTPTLYEVPSFNKYNTITWWHPFSGALFQKFNANPQLACKAYGIRWLVRHPQIGLDEDFIKGLGAPAIVGGMQVWEVKDAAPMAFPLAHPATSYHAEFSAKGATVHFEGEGYAYGEPFVINVLAWPRFHVYADGKEIAKLPDEWGRIVATPPPGTKRLEAVYKSPWGQGIAIGLALMLLSAAGWKWRGSKSSGR
jgi:hypothetical protein